MRRGEVWWHEPPEEKRRPVLILTREEAIGQLDKLIVAPATGTIRGIRTEVRLGRDDGMPLDCVLSLDNIALVRRAHLIERLTVLDPEKMHEVCRALEQATGCG